MQNNGDGYEADGPLERDASRSGDASHDDMEEDAGSPVPAADAAAVSDAGGALAPSNPSDGGISTARGYYDTLVKNGVQTKFVEDSHAGHQWLPSAPNEVVQWFLAH